MKSLVNAAHTGGGGHFDRATTTCIMVQPKVTAHSVDAQLMRRKHERLHPRRVVCIGSRKMTGDGHQARSSYSRWIPRIAILLNVAE